MTREEVFFKKRKCKSKHCSSMSNIVRCDIKKNILKLHDYCSNPNCKCQKQITFTSRQFQLEGGPIKSKLKSIFKGTKTTWDKFLKPALNMASRYIAITVSAQTKNPKIGQATTNILKSISGGKILSLTDMQGRGLRLKVM